MLPPSVYTSPRTDPALPRSSVFDYLFPRDNTFPFYPAPRTDPRRSAFVDALTGRSVTRAQVGEHALALAGGLKKLGLEAGDVACIFGMNSIEWVNALLGCQARGVITSPANYAYTPTELLHQLKDSTSKAVLVQPGLIPILHEALKLDPALGIPDSRVILICTKQQKPADLQKFKCTEEIREYGEGVDGRHQWKQGDEVKTAYLCYSSGTTGKGKGVETSHHNMTSQIQAVSCSFEKMTEQDVVLGILPFSHIYGLTMNIHHALTADTTVIVLPRFDEIPYKITFGIVVPPIILVLLHSANVPKYDISTIRGLQSGAAPLSADLIQAFQTKFPWIGVTQGYGLTETTPVAAVMTLDEAKGHQGSTGKLIPTYQARLVDAESGKDVPKGERGELWLRGPSVMKGYWRNAEATKAAFQDGFFKTGDVAVIDEQGYISIVDRVKELVKYKGFQVPPAELEALLLTHSEVVDVAVIGIYSKAQATELPRAYVVPKKGLASLSPSAREQLSKEIHDWAASKTANHKRLRGGVILIDAIPKSPSGKILRKDLRVLAAKEEEQEVVAGRKAKL
ncbi:hypothetical protein I350_06839 [Cryptococcus amylolentus CBS 6273]|uniref:AMP-dependent synthetase/ligase domain-containing protein n=1 Tax=Cryptococcus amylolentus CBS 6273 TaxID=1296118 RepID=A0A1E3JH96_9TREE|nr:hypothetical protein I350_06839 [Cryptococcus amylolentus CBS 6273]